MGATRPAGRLSRGRRAAVAALLVLATLVAVTGIFAVWADRQLLDADNWAETSTRMLADDDIRTAVAGFAVDEAYLRVDVAGELETALPPRLQPLAGPAAGALRGLAERGAKEALGRPRVQELWRTANRATAQQFINVAEGDSGAVTSSGNAVVLDLRFVLRDIVARLGLPGTVVARIPDGAGRVTILSGDEVRTLQNAATTLDGFAVVLPLLAIALLALAVWIARGSRRRTLLGAGWALVLAGAIVLVGRNVAGGAVVDALAPTESVRPAAESAWSIGTDMLRDIAQACVIIGIPLIVAAWLAGPTRVAVALRRALSPWLRERPELAYGAGVALALLVVAWGPIPATRMPLPVLLMLALVIAGVAALRVQVEREFATATETAVEGAAAGTAGPAGAAGTAAADSAGTAAGTSATTPTDTSISAHVARLRTALARPRPETAGEGTADAAPTTGGGDGGRSDQVALLERLAALHERGALTDEEFEEEKQLVLHGTGIPT